MKKIEVSCKGVLHNFEAEGFVYSDNILEIITNYKLIAAFTSWDYCKFV